MEFVWSTRRSAETDEVRPLSCDRQYHSHTTVGYQGNSPTRQLSLCRNEVQVSVCATVCMSTCARLEYIFFKPCFVNTFYLTIFLNLGVRVPGDVDRISKCCLLQEKFPSAPPSSTLQLFGPTSPHSHHVRGSPASAPCQRDAPQQRKALQWHRTPNRKFRGRTLRHGPRPSTAPGGPIGCQQHPYSGARSTRSDSASATRLYSRAHLPGVQTHPEPSHNLLHTHPALLSPLATPGPAPFTLIIQHRQRRRRRAQPVPDRPLPTGERLHFTATSV